MDELGKKKSDLEVETIEKWMNLAGITHDMKNPLTSILGYSSLFRDGCLGEINSEQKECIDIILQSSKHLLKMVDKILLLSKDKYFEKYITLSKINIRDFIPSLIKNFLLMAKAKHIELKLDIEDNLPLLETDSLKLYESCANLLSNAIKYSGTHKIVSLKANLKDEKMIEIHVIDEGPGISDNDLYLLFHPFYRLNNYFNEKQKGTGLGLYNVRCLMTSLNGFVSVKTEPDKGADFILHLPISHSTKISQTPDHNNVLFLGLKNAGKTSIISYIKDKNKISIYMPTITMVISKMNEDADLSLIDTPGQDKLRYIWNKGIKMAKVIVYVLDVADKNSFEDSFEALNLILNDPLSKHLPIIFLMHKIDLKVPYKLIKKMKESILNKFQNNQFYFFDTSIMIPETINVVKKFIKEELYSLQGSVIF